MISSFLLYIESFGCQLQSSHFALAFEVPGGWNSEKESVILTVMQVLELNFASSII